MKHVIDSRRGDFAEAVMELTDRQGVDVVLNALAGEAIPMGLSCLAEFGRFIEIGKRDIYQNSRIPLWPLRRNASFHVVAMDAVFSGDESLTRADARRDLRAGREEARSRPLPFRSFPASRIDAAFRLMASGKHIGKVVVSFPEAVRPAARRTARAAFRDQARRLLSDHRRVWRLWQSAGASGWWNAARVISCSPAAAALPTPEAEAFVQACSDRGVTCGW